MDPWTVLFIMAVTAFAAYQAGRRAAAGPRLPGLGQGDSPAPDEAATSRIYALAGQVNAEVGHPADFLQDAAFIEGVDHLRTGGFSREKLLAYATGTHPVVAGMALEALGGLPADASVRRRLRDGFSSMNYWQQYFTCRALRTHAGPDQPVVGPILASVARRREEEWGNLPGFGGEYPPLLVDLLADFARERIRQGETINLADVMDQEDAPSADGLRELIRALKVDGLEPMLDQLASWEQGHLDESFLGGVGKILPPGSSPTVIQHPALARAVDEMEELIAAERPRSLVMVGERGVGKSAAAHSLFNRLRRRGWKIFEAGPGDILADQSFIGQLEGRLRRLVRNLHAGRRVVWYIPQIHHLAWTGRHQHSTSSALDYILPFIERGELAVVGEADSTGYERMAQVAPSAAAALQTVRLEPLPPDETLQLARKWAGVTDGVSVSEGLLAEALQLSLQFLGETSPPGNLLSFLKQACERAGVGVELGKDHLIETLTTLTGLPATILDERLELDPAGLESRFRERVKGQPEAVTCLVERIAMLKAGVTDPTRPTGVFLFAGPTGTGKTEIAKCLAETLFGSADRMIRLDMSELQTAESVARILGGPGDDPTGQRSLTSEIRKTPFSVILLDEFEKAHEKIWDLFLQVFDDGRLTDLRGNVADFRHAIIILTTNLGAAPARATLGFQDSSGHFAEGSVRKAISRIFRPEFINRLDRVVVFHPLTRETMREILDRELNEVFERRGLRNRSWAVEWDDTAVEFLLDRGVTQDLGARPLKRAIERHLLAPLALTIVNHQYPQGDQFLFVRRDGQHLEVAFVDPDAEEPPAEEAPEPLPGDAGDLCALRKIAHRPGGAAGELALLGGHLDRLRGAVSEGAWVERKQEDLSRMSSPGFWSAPERYGILGRIEYMDRIEAGLRRAESLYQRVSGPAGGRRDRYPASMVRQLAQRLFLIDTAVEDVRESRPCEAFLQVSATRGHETPGAGRTRFAREVAGMYRAWARRRGMEAETLEESAESAPGYRVLMAFSGSAPGRSSGTRKGFTSWRFPASGGGWTSAATR